MKSLRVLLSLFLLLTFAFSEEKLQKVSVQLNWKPQFEFAGFYAAKEMGFYEEIGLDVEIKPFDHGTEIINDVKNKKSTYGLYDLSLLSYYDEDKPLILLANYFKKSGLVIITKQDIFTPYDLKNKTILANEEELKSTSLSTLLKKFNITYDDFKEVVPHDFTANKFINGEVDAMTAYISNELYHIKKAHIPYNILDVSNYGVFNYTQNLFTSKEEAQNYPLRTRNFIEATNKGWEYALKNKEKIAKLIYEKHSQIKGLDALMFEADEIEKLIMPDLYTIGSLDNRFLLESMATAKRQGYMPNHVSLNDLVFNKNLFLSESYLSEEEREYVKGLQEITMCIDPDWMPFEKLENAQHIGISKDYMDVFEKELGTTIRMVPTRTWAESLRYAKNRTCDILSMAMQTKDRDEYLNFTSAYFNSPLVIATKVDEMFIADIESVIHTKALGIVKGYAFSEILRRRFPNNQIVDVDSVDDGLDLVAKGEIFGFVDTLATIGYRIQNDYLGELKIAGKLDEELALSIAVRNDDMMLLNIFEKMIAHFDDNKKHEILNKWVNVKYDKGFDYKIIWQILAASIAVIAVFVYRNKELIRHKKELESKNKELYKTQDKLHETLKSYEVLLSSTMESVYVVEDTKCIDSNEVGFISLGYLKKEQILGQDILSILDEESVDLIVRAHYILNEPLEVKVKRVDDTLFPALLKISLATIENRRVRIFSLIDLSELKHKEQLLLKQSKMASMGEMIGNIAHQWRQPLSMISTVSTGIALKLENKIVVSNDEMIKDLKKLNEASQLLSKTIDDFRNFFSVDKQMTQFKFDDLVESNLLILDPIFKGHYIQLVCDYDENIHLLTYQNELTQALLNILTNAKDALVANASDERFIFIEAKQLTDEVIIEVKDNGGGIDENFIHKVFEPYFTTKHQSHGTGIGLYMTHQIIVEHIGGKIDVENRSIEYNNNRYRGACFRISIPI